MSNEETSLLEFILAAATKSGYWLLDRIEMKFRKLQPQSHAGGQEQ